MNTVVAFVAVICALAEENGLANTAARDTVPVSRPNIVLVVVDTLRSDHVGCYGYFRQTTPNIDGLAAEGVLFRNAVTIMPHTLPAHLSLFTSRYPGEHEVLMNGQVYSGKHVTMAEILRKAGYRTGAFVSGFPVNKKFGIDRGFDEYINASSWKVASEKAGRSAMDWIGTQHGEPFFAWLHLYDTHIPYSPPEEMRPLFATDDRIRKWVAERGVQAIREWRTVADRTTITHIPPAKGEMPFFHNLNLYDAEVRHADRTIGELLRFLESRELDDSTLVIITSDHGEGLGEHDFWFHGPNLYEEQLLIPLVLRFPDAVHGGRVIDETVSLLDILPTVVDVTGLEMDEAFQGQSLLELITGSGGSGHTDTFSESRVFPPRKSRSPAYWTEVRRFAIRTNQWKFILASDGTEELYDLRADPQEMNSVLALEVKVARQLRSRLERWMEAAVSEKVERPKLSDKDRKKLKALGYIDD